MSGFDKEKTEEYWKAIGSDETIAHLYSGHNRGYGYGYDRGCSSPWGRNIDGCTTARPEFDRYDHEHWRPQDALPVRHLDIMWECNYAYEINGVIRNIIDLMSDFACAGIRPVHPSQSVQRFYENWFHAVRGPYVTERLLSNFFRFGTAIVRRNEDTLTKVRRRNLALAADLDEFDLPPNNRSRKIPCGYRFENPAMIDVIGGDLNGLSNSEPQLGIFLPYYMIEQIRKPDGVEHLVNKLPEDLVRQIMERKEGGLDMFYPISSDNLEVLHYKKDDWQNWSKPIIYSILKDIKLVEKMQLADFSVLDSALDMVRIFKIGSLEHAIPPTEEACTKLAQMIEANNMGGIRNIIWGPDLELQESKVTGIDLLGDEKYVNALNNIHAGMGIPPTVTGISPGGGGTTNNHISLKILIERLCYARELVKKFWAGEFARVRRAVRNGSPVKVQFEITNLEDQDAQQRIWIELADRNIVSNAWVQEHIGADPRAEQARINREHNEQIAGKKTPKASPWHDPQMEEKAAKMLLEQGRISPQDVGLDLPDNMQTDPSGNPQTPSEQPNQLNQLPGRPPGARDGEPRKRRKFKPQIKAMQLWAKKAQDEVSTVVNAQAMERFAVSTLRKLNAEQTEEVNKIKFEIFMGMSPWGSVEDGIGEPIVTWEEYSEVLEATEEAVSTKLTLEDKLEIQRDLFVETVHG